MKYILLTCLILHSTWINTAEEENQNIVFNTTPQRAIQIAIDGGPIAYARTAHSEKKAKEPIIFGYKKDFVDLAFYIENGFDTQEIIQRLNVDFNILSTAIEAECKARGSESQVRLPAAYQLNKLSDPTLFREFIKKSDNKDLLNNALNQIQQFTGKDKLYDDFVLLSEPTPSRKKKHDLESSQLTASQIHEPLTFAVAALDTAIETAEKQLASEESEDLTRSTLPRQFEASTPPEDLTQSTIGGPTMPQPQLAQPTTPRATSVSIKDQVDRILAWPAEATTEKIIALQFLSAFQHYRARQTTNQNIKIAIYTKSTHISNALYFLNAPLFSIEQVQAKKIKKDFVRRYKIPHIAPIPETTFAKYLKEYDQTKENILGIFCASVADPKAIMSLSQAHPKTKLAKIEEIRTAYSVCNYVYNTQNEAVKKKLAECDTYVNELTQEPTTTAASAPIISTPTTPATATAALAKFIPNREDENRLKKLEARSTNISKEIKAKIVFPVLFKGMTDSSKAEELKQAATKLKNFSDEIVQFRNHMATTMKLALDSTELNEKFKKHFDDIAELKKAITQTLNPLKLQQHHRDSVENILRNTNQTITPKIFASIPEGKDDLLKESLSALKAWLNAQSEFDSIGQKDMIQLWIAYELYNELKNHEQRSAQLSYLKDIEENKQIFDNIALKALKGECLNIAQHSSNRRDFFTQCTEQGFFNNPEICLVDFDLNAEIAKLETEEQEYLKQRATKQPNQSITPTTTISPTSTATPSVTTTTTTSTMMPTTAIPTTSPQAPPTSTAPTPTATTTTVVPTATTPIPQTQNPTENPTPAPKPGIFTRVYNWFASWFKPTQPAPATKPVVAQPTRTWGQWFRGFFGR